MATPEETRDGIEERSATLEGLRVLDLGDRASSAWCARLLADLGADVVGVERPSGHPLRADPPAAQYLLANRRRADASAIGRLAPDADVIITTDASPGATAAAVRERAPDALIVSITPYGIAGDLAGRPGNDLTAYATSGWATVNGLAAREPLKGSGYNASFQSGTFAWAAATAALLGEPAGETLDIAERDVLCSTFSPAFLRQQYTGSPEGRREAADLTAGPVPVADGYFALTLSRPYFWQSAMRVLGLDDLADVPELQTMPQRNARTEMWMDRVQEAMLGWKRLELFDALAARRVIAGPVLDMGDLDRNPQLIARGYFAAPDEAPPATARQPGPPARYSRSQWRLARPAPAATEAARQWAGGGLRLPGAGDRAPASPAAPGVGPLAGYRGLVLTQAWAGTYATELLALLGAEIVQVEVRKRLDSWRGTYASPVPAGLREREVPGDAWNLNPLFNSVNLGKRSVTLDLATPEGVDLFRRMVPRFDFIAENFSPRVMGNLGLAYDDLRMLRDDVILASLSAYGADGPWSPVPGIGGTIEPSSGMSSVLGYVAGGPMNSGHMYPDPVAGLYGFGALLTALVHRRRTGQGQYIDLSMQEACATFVGDEWMRYLSAGVAPGPRGNRHPAYAPHGIFACEGTDQWVAIAAPDDAAWAGLIRVLGNTAPGEPLADDRFGSAAGRLGAQDALERAINRCTASWDKEQLSAQLLGAGVIAAPVLDVGEVLADSGLAQRGTLRPVTHALAGEAQQAGLPLVMKRSGLPAWTSAPLHGEHSFEVLSQELGLDPETFAALEAAGITGCGPVEEGEA